jgi:hypothetical protein
MQTTKNQLQAGGEMNEAELMGAAKNSVNHASEK